MLEHPRHRPPAAGGVHAETVVVEQLLDMPKEILLDLPDAPPGLSWPQPPDRMLSCYHCSFGCFASVVLARFAFNFVNRYVPAITNQIHPATER